MKDCKYENEVAKIEYFRYVKGADGCAESSLKKYARSIKLWLIFTENENLANFNKETVEKFKEHLKNSSASLPSQYDTLRYLRKFFKWLCEQKGYEKIKSSDIAYLHLSKNDTRAALEKVSVIFPKLDEIRTLISSIRGDSEVELRDRALICFLALTGTRISATVSLPIESFDRQNLIFKQSPKIGVKTKNKKSFLTTFLPIEIENGKEYFLSWFDYLINEKGFGPKDPIFPATNQQHPEEITNKPWASGGAARKMIKKRFSDVGLPSHYPHSFRHAASDAVKHLPGITDIQKKAISMNFGHSNVGTTFDDYGYGSISASKAIDIVKELCDRPKEAGQKSFAELLREAADRIEQLEK